MRKVYQKIFSSLILSATVLVVGGFCGAPMVGATLPEMKGTKSMTEITDVHCGSTEKVAAGNSAPVSDAVMPCCVEKHDNSSVFTPVAPNEKIKFEQISIAQQSVLLVQSINQKTYASSSSPPEPKIFSSCARLE
jgi:hypothetical protein